jgi:hypothetical protein
MQYQRIARLLLSVVMVAAAAAFTAPAASARIPQTIGRCLAAAPPPLGNYENAECSVTGEAIGGFEIAEANKKGFEGASLAATFTITTAAVKIACQEDKIAKLANFNKITEVYGANKVVMTYEECEGDDELTNEKCPVKSNGAAGAKEVVTEALKGELGRVKAAEAKTEVGLLFEPEQGTVISTIEGKCLPATPEKVEGSVAGEVKQVGKKVEAPEVEFSVTPAGKQVITKIVRTRTNAEAKPRLTAGVEVVSLKVAQHLKFEEPLWVGVGN